MDSSLKSKVAETLAKGQFSEQDAAWLSDVFDNIDTRQGREVDLKLKDLLTQKDKTDIIKQIYIVGLIQFTAIVASVLAIVKFMS